MNIFVVLQLRSTISNSQPGSDYLELIVDLVRFDRHQCTQPSVANSCVVFFYRQQMLQINDFDSDDNIRHQESKGALTLYYLKILQDENTSWISVFDRLYNGKKFKNVLVEQYIQQSDFMAQQVVRRLYISDLFQTSGQLDPNERIWSILWKTTQCKSVLKIGHYSLVGLGVQAPILINLETMHNASIEHLRSDNYDIKDDTRTSLLLVAIHFLVSIGIKLIKFTADSDKLSNVYLPYRGKTYKIYQQDGKMHISLISTRQIGILDDDTILANTMGKKIMDQLKKIKETIDG